jgi:molybdate/tungstate transport system substrate-binding protein
VPGLALRLGITLGLIGVTALPAAARSVLRVAYAGSMGVVMDLHLGPDFCRLDGCRFEGMGRGAWALAHLIASRSFTADVFISVTSGPMDFLRGRRWVRHAVAVARTEMVLAYNPHSRFAPLMRQAKTGRPAWWQVLEKPGLRLGRTDPRVDPQGRNVIFVCLLAGNQYHRPRLAHRLLGAWENSVQIFSEPSLMTRLEAGQLDVAITYRSAAVSHHLPYVSLPAAINLGSPTRRSTYRRVSFRLAGTGQRVYPAPLVFYAGILRGTRHSVLARAFIAYLGSSAAAVRWQRLGYAPIAQAVR